MKYIKRFKDLQSAVGQIVGNPGLIRILDSGVSTKKSNVTDLLIVNSTGNLVEYCPPNNEIWYITSDNSIVNPSEWWDDGTLISNEYKNGKGVMTFANDVTDITELFDNEGSTHETLTKVILPNSVKTVGEYAFNCCPNLTSVIMQDGVEIIEVGAFFDCKSLASLELPNTVTTIGETAFYECINLTSVIMHDGLETIGATAFFGCENLVDLEIPNTVTTIGDHAFSKCASLTSLIIPDSVIEIGEYSFDRCSNLTSVTIGRGLKTIERQAFRYCYALTSVIMQDGLETIGLSAFHTCTNLIVTIPDSVTSIGNFAFSSVPHIYYNGPAEGAPWGALAMN